MKTFPTFPLQAPADEGKGGAGGGAAAPAAGAGAGSGAPAAGAGAGGDPKAAAGAADKGAPSPGADAGQKKGDAGEAGKKPADGVPAKLELKLPDGVTLDAATWGKFEPFLQKAGMNSEQASQLATLYTELRKDEATNQTQAWDQIRDGWNKELRADKEFGGPNYDANAALAEKAVIRFGGKELSDQLAKYGMDNLPILAKAFAKIGRAIKEDSSSIDTAGPPASKALSPQEKKANFYKGEPKR